MTEVHITMGAEDDAGPAAGLHVAGIDQGFLSTLGPTFLTLLYRRVVLSEGSFLLVARRDGSGSVLGFLAGTTSTRRLYTQFLLRDGARAVLSSPRPVLRGAGRAFETLRYGSGVEGAPGGGGHGALPDAELLSMAVTPDARGSGIGRALADRFMVELAARHVGAARVVVGADNRPAQALYRSVGFRPAARIEVHRGRASDLLVWP